MWDTNPLHDAYKNKTPGGRHDKIRSPAPAPKPLASRVRERADRFMLPLPFAPRGPVVRSLQL
jgi:hypothetical protein